MTQMQDDGGRGRGRTVTVIVGVAVAVAVAIGGVLLFGLFGGDDTTYRLTTPKSLAGEYQRDGKGTKGDGKAFGDKKVPGMTSHADVNAKYKSGTSKKLQLGGAYGKVADPAKAVDWVVAQTAKSLKTATGAKAKGKPKVYAPTGFDGDVLKCQEFEISDMSLGMCSWADASTVGTISVMELSSDGTSSKPVKLSKTAEVAAEVREDALVAEKD
ncbi:MAG: hypothetical protein ACRDP3_06900 [Streptomyces sp.]|uniref:hypothetical protein n=1 Tax=Streptomyces sp. TaxID=1931 RepID=UPI003D6A2A94